jgi:hypothetical protein
MEQLVIGTITAFDAPYNEMGLNDKASYVDVHLAGLLVKLLDVTGAFELIENSGFAGLIELLNVDDREKANGPAPVDYSKAPQPTAVERPGWLSEAQARFLAGNADGILNWAWRELINYENADAGQPIKAWLEELLGITIESTLTETFDNLLGSNLYTQDNFDGIVAALAGLKDSLDGIEFAGLTLPQILAKMAVIDGKPVDIDAMFASLAAHVAGGDGYVTVTAANFMDALAELLKPFMPLLNVLLAEADIKLIVDDSVNNGAGFLIIDGYDGYRTGLLPILLGLGADVPGFIETLVPYEDFLALDDEGRLEAILGPILYLFSQMAADPVHTLLRVLPNAAYFTGTGKGPSLLSQAAGNILHPISVLLGYLPEGAFDLNMGEALNALLDGLLNGLPFTLEDMIVGDVNILPEPWNMLGKDEEASYVEVDETQLLIQILILSGALDQLDEETLAGLMNLLNLDNTRPDGPGKIDYSKAPSATVVEPLSWLSEAQAKFLLDNADAVLNWVWRELAGNPTVKSRLEELLGIAIEATIEETVQGLLGSTLYTQENFDRIVDLFMGLKESLDSAVLIDGLSLAELLKTAVKLYDEDTGVYTDFDLDAFFAGFVAYAAAPTSVSGEAAFKAKLYDLLTPMVPLLRVLLTESDLVFLVDPEVNNNNGLIKIFGSNGYETGLLPLLLGLGVNIDGFTECLLEFSDFKALNDTDMLAAIFDPILYLLNKAAQSPLDTLLQLLPNAAFLLGGEDSILQQAIDNILFPLDPVLQAIPGLNTDLSALDVSGLLEGLLSGLPFGLEKLIVGEIKVFDEPWNEVGLEDAASYLEVNRTDLLIQLLRISGALELLDEETLAGLMDLLNLDNTRPDGPGKIDYSKAPGAVNVTYPSWLKKSQAQFLADNADGVLNWAWRTLVKGNTALKESVNFPLEDTLEDTVYRLLGSYLYTSDNLDMIVAAVLSIKEQLDGIEFAGLTLAEILEMSVKIYDENTNTYRPLDLETLFEKFEAYVPGVPIAGPEAFKDALIDLLRPMLPLLRVFLAEGDLVFIVDPDVNDNNGLIKVFGSNGYETGLLPLLLGLGADVPGYLDTIGPYQAIKDSDDDTVLLSAILDPILFLLDRLTKDPVNTAIAVLSNSAYFIPLLPQAIDNILFPLEPVLRAIPSLDIDLSGLNVTSLLEVLLSGLPFDPEDLIVGEITIFGESWNEVGLDDAASYLAVEKADLLVQLLKVFGAFDLLEQNNLTGLIKLLDSNTSEGPGPISYPQVDTSADKSLYKNWWWTKKQATEMAARSGEFLDGLWTILYGKPFGSVSLQPDGQSVADSFLRDLIGNALYTEENFNKLLSAVQAAIPVLTDIELIPGRTLYDLLREIVTVGGEKVDIPALLEHISNWQSSGELNTQAGFIGNLVDYLEPLAPLLDFLLFDAEITILGGEADINGGKGLVSIPGYNGYQYGLIPIYEALLVPLDAQKEILPPSTLRSLTSRAKVEALLHPLLYTIETLVTNPLDNLLLMLPNLSYFLTPDGNGDSLLQQCVDRVLYPLNNILSSVSETTIEIDSVAMLDDLLKSLGIAGLDMKLIAQLRIGTLTQYTSISGIDARYIRLDSDSDWADLLTVLLRAFVDVLKDSKNRAPLIDLLANALGLSGFSKMLLGWKVNMVLWAISIFPNGTDMSLRFTLGMAKLMMFFMPVILFAQKIFGFLF